MRSFPDTHCWIEGALAFEWNARPESDHLDPCNPNPVATGIEMPKTVPPERVSNR